MIRSIFNKPFLEGLAGGIATSASKGIQGAMDDYDDRIQRIARSRVNKAEEETKRFNKEFKENQEDIKLLEAQLNQNGSTRGIEVLHSIIAKNSYSYAKNVVPEIAAKLIRTGMKVEQLYPLPELSTDGTKKIPTQNQLANSITIPMDFGLKDSDMGTALEGTGMNILNIFTRGRNNALKQAKKYIQTEMALSGYGEGTLQTDYGELPAPASPSINVDRFELMLGESYAKDLGLINARLENLDPKTEEYSKLKNRKIELETIINGNADKVIPSGSSAERQTANMLIGDLGSAMGLEWTLNEGVWYGQDAKTENASIAKNYGNQLTSFLLMSKLPENRGKNNVTMGGYISESARRLIKKDDVASAIPYDERLPAMEFLKYAATNLLNVEFVTKEMIKNGIAEDKNGDGSPYLTVDGEISYNTNQIIEEPKDNIVDNKSDNSNIKSPKDNDAINKQLQSLKTEFLNNLSNSKNGATVARKIKNILRDNLPNATEIILKEKFKDLTGKDWDDKAYDLITK